MLLISPILDSAKIEKFGGRLHLASEALQSFPTRTGGVESCREAHFSIPTVVRPRVATAARVLREDVEPGLELKERWPHALPHEVPQVVDPCSKGIILLVRYLPRTPCLQ